MNSRIISLLFLFSINCFAQHLYQVPKPLKPKADLEKIIGPLSTKKPTKKLNVLWVYGYDKHHIPGAHDYVKVKDLMLGLLNKVPNVTAKAVFGFPTQEQFANTDLIVMYLHLPQLKNQQYTNFENYIKRGGGVVSLHETVIMRPSSDGKKLSKCLGMAWNQGVSQWGAIFDDINIKNDHTIFTGFPKKLKIVDEFYWKLHQQETAEVLGSVRTGSSGNSNGPLPKDQLSKDESPMFWTYKLGKGKVFGTTTGHHTFTYYDPEFRIVLFRAMAWVVNEKADPFMPLVFEGITNAQDMVGTTDAMRNWKGKKRK